MIEVFGFNLTNGVAFEMHNTTVEDIKKALKERFPKWSDEVIEKILSKKEYYKEVIPVETQKRVVKRGSISKVTMTINGYELNPILNLGQSIHAYQKHAYRCWGNIVNNIFHNVNVAKMFDNFEKKYDGVVVAVKSQPMESKQVITQRVIDMCHAMNDLKSAIQRTGWLQKDAEEEYINGNDRRLGIGELMLRVEEMCGECNDNIKTKK